MSGQYAMAQDKDITLYKLPTRGGALFDGVLTSIAWIGFILLIVTGLYNIWRVETSPEAEHIQLYGHLMLFSLYTVLWYLGIGLLLLLTLVSWSRYNTWRWRGKERRTRFPDLDVEKLPSYFGADRALVARLQSASVVTIHSDQNGDIHFLTHAKGEERDCDTVLPADEF